MKSVISLQVAASDYPTYNLQALFFQQDIFPRIFASRKASSIRYLKCIEISKNNIEISI